jgi:hypothetical protein
MKKLLDCILIVLFILMTIFVMVLLVFFEGIILSDMFNRITDFQNSLMIY